jgi:hypothetical protein
LCEEAVFSGDSLRSDDPPSLPFRLTVIISEIGDLEVKNGPTQSRKAKEGEAQPETAGIL